MIAGMGVGEIPSAALSAADAQSIEDCVVAVEDCVGSVDVVVVAVGVVGVVVVAVAVVGVVLGGDASGFASAPKAAAAAVQWVEDFAASFGGSRPAARRCRRPAASGDSSGLF